MLLDDSRVSLSAFGSQADPMSQKNDKDFIVEAENYL